MNTALFLTLCLVFSCSTAQNCSLPNCLTAVCDDDGNEDARCTECAPGWWVNVNETCSACGTCESGEFISFPCGGYTDTVCSPCTPCDADQTTVTPCPGTGTTDSTVCEDNGNNGGGNGGGNDCSIPNCRAADCWTDDNGQTGRCTECEDGWWINAGGNCDTCGSCQLGEYISYPCGGYTNTVCSPCTPCDAGRETIALCPGTGNSDSTICGDNSVCPLPENCLEADCWPSDDAENGLQVQCTQCADGFWINASWTCEPCQNCDVGEFISYPCGGWTPTICSACTPCDFGEDPIAPCPGTGNTDSTVCDNCLPGHAHNDDGTCQPLLCQLYGCGVANIGAICSENNATSWICSCPDGNSTVVSVGGQFAGCNINPPTDEEVVAAINITALEAFLVNGILEIRGVALVTVDGATFTINIDTEISIDNIANQLKDAIASFLGGSYTADDVSLNWGSRKRDRDTLVDITIGGDSDSAPSLASHILFLAPATLSLYLFR